MRPEIRTINPLAVPLQECSFNGEPLPSFLDDLMYGCCKLPEYGAIGLKYSVLKRVLTRLSIVSTSEVYSLLYYDAYDKYVQESNVRQARRYAAAARYIIGGLNNQSIKDVFQEWCTKITANLLGP